MIYEQFRATGVFEAAQGLADLVSMTLHMMLSKISMYYGIVYYQQ